MHDLNPEDRYLLRKAQMDADKKDLESQKAHQDLERLVLEIEYRTGIIAGGGSLDPRTGVIQGTTLSRKNNGKESSAALIPTISDETSI